MEIFHNSQDIKYRSPFGAVKTNTSVTLRLDVKSSLNAVSVYLYTNKNGEENFIKMHRKETYEVTVVMPDKPCLFRYSFMVETPDKKIWYVNSDGLGGAGACAQTSDKTYQITVYDENYTTPDWFCGRIMYQIFPDRFFGEHENGAIWKKRDEYIIHYDAYEPFSFNRHPYEDGPACNDFYGGNLKGIIKKLPYIKSLGVGVIYLNPIFDAYSNHKYDTANYMEIDPMFGNEEDFKELCSKAKKLDIRIILDGVFSHTGSDSVYFNKYKNYGSGGAYNDVNSPYRSWYQFNQNGYESWWGCTNLPNVNEMNEDYLNYILRDENSVIKKWIKLGASGWRLDVADELPDEFIKILREEVKKTDPDAVVIGEVWEDASNKVAYSHQREYLLGDELDSVMNYPFRDNVTAFLMGYIDAETMNKRLMSIMENYPVCTLYSLMNHIGTHDTMRIKSLFGGKNENCKNEQLESGMEALATYRLRCAAFLQMTYVGVASIYYGDEIGMQGGKDPYNRAPFTWRRVDTELLSEYQRLGELRNNLSVLRTGHYKTLYANGDVFVFARYFENGRNVFGEKAGAGFAICAVNRSFENRTVEVDLTGITHNIETENDRLLIDIEPVGYKIIHS